MRGYLVKTPEFIQRFFRQFAWRISTAEKVIYLTFDDGPVPDFTPWVLDILKHHGAKATFFCVGENVKKYPRIYRQILADGHSVGNHTFNHLKGWNTSIKKYVKNTLKAEAYMERHGKLTKKLFRPPHGRIRPIQAKKLRSLGYKIVMWDVLSGDFDQSLSKKECLDLTIKHIESGSIVVFHDSDKSFKNLDYVLPRVLTHFEEQGFEFRPL